MADRYLKHFPVVAILGARQVGKTTLAKQLAPGWKYFDLERQADFNFITNNIDTFFEEFTDQVIIDEAQDYP